MMIMRRSMSRLVSCFFVSVTSAVIAVLHTTTAAVGQHHVDAPRDSTCVDAARAAHDDQAHAEGLVTDHMAVFCGLVPRADATDVARSTGPWSSPATWGGALPTADAKVLIPSGITVTVDRVFDTSLFWVRVDGVLRFTADADSTLTADTVVVDPGGRLEMGTVTTPVPAQFTARLVLKPRNGARIDHAWDPLELSRGLIAHGVVQMHGTPRTPFVPVSVLPQPGTETVQADAPPSGWAPGDHLVLTATEYDQDEGFRLRSVVGSTIGLDHPIQHARIFPRAPDGRLYDGLALHLANFTRNVQVRTASDYAGDPALQGHVMLMHNGGHRIAWAGFYDLGRTTVRPVTDPSVTAGTRDPGISPNAGITEDNVRGRYSLHFHRAGPASNGSVVEGCAIAVSRGAGLKIGLANHSSRVSVRNCVSLNIDGSHFFTEEGDELGEFRGNLAIHSTGSGASHDELPRDVMLKRDPELFNKRRLDVGHRGTGFWLNGGGVDVIDNVSTGHAHAGFNVWARGLDFRKDTFSVQFPVENLPDRSWAKGQTEIRISDVPITFTGNVAYVLASGKDRGEAGFVFDYHGLQVPRRFPNAPSSLMHDLLTWNTGGIATSYTGNIHLKNVRVIGGDRSRRVGVNISAQGANGYLVEGLTVEGFPQAVALPSQSVVRGGRFGTEIGLLIDPQKDPDLVIDLTGMKFGSNQATSGASPPYEIQVWPLFEGGPGAQLADAFNPHPIMIEGHPTFGNDAQLYAVEQMPEYVLPDFGIPGLLDGKTTTAQAWATHRLAPGGAVAPTGATADPLRWTNGRFGRRTGHDVPLAYRVAAPKPGPYVPKVSIQTDEGRRARVERESVTLAAGWNLVPIVVEGVKRTLIIHAGRLPKLPHVDAGPDQVVSVGTRVQLSGNGAAAAGSMVWRQAFGPAPVDIGDPRALKTTAGFARPGLYVLHLTVTNEAGLKNTDSVTILVG